ASPGPSGDRTATASATLDYGIGVLVALHPAGTRAAAVPPVTSIVFDGASSATYASDSTTSLRLTAPTAAEAGDVLIASLGVGSSEASAQPLLTPPAGWTLVTRTSHGSVATAAVYRHVFVAGETSYTWTSSFKVGGAIFLAAF